MPSSRQDKITPARPAATEAAPSALPLAGRDEATGQLIVGQQSAAAAKGVGSPLANERRSALTRRLLHERLARRSVFRADLFGEAGWDTLLYLCSQPDPNQATPLSVVAAAIGASEGTTLRWANGLTTGGHITLHRDKGDDANPQIAITAQAIQLVDTFLDQIAD